MEVYLVQQTVAKHTYFVGIFSSWQNAVDCIGLLAENESDQDYRQVDINVWYGKTRTIEILRKSLDEIPRSATPVQKFVTIA